MKCTINYLSLLRSFQAFCLSFMIKKDPDAAIPNKNKKTLKRQKKKKDIIIIYILQLLQQKTWIVLSGFWKKQLK